LRELTHPSSSASSSSSATESKKSASALISARRVLAEEAAASFEGSFMSDALKKQSKLEREKTRDFASRSVGSGAENITPRASACGKSANALGFDGEFMSDSIKKYSRVEREKSVSKTLQQVSSDENNSNAVNTARGSGSSTLKRKFTNAANSNDSWSLSDCVKKMSKLEQDKSKTIKATTLETTFSDDVAQLEAEAI
jgi:hypothetical protein